MPAKTTKKPSKIGTLLSRLNPNSPKKKLLLFVLVFGLMAGGYYAYRSFAATAQDKFVFIAEGYWCGDSEKDTRLETINGDGSGRKRLGQRCGREDGNYNSVAISPSKQQLAVSIQNVGSTRSSLYTKNMDGSNTKKIVTEAAAVPIYRVVWNGNYIYYQTGYGNDTQRIKRYSTVTGNKSTIYTDTNDKTYIEDFKVSPNGQKLILEERHFDDGVSSTYVKSLPASGGSIYYSELYPAPINIIDLVWQADSENFVVAVGDQLTKIHYSGNPKVVIENADFKKVKTNNSTAKHNGVILGMFTNTLGELNMSEQHIREYGAYSTSIFTGLYHSVAYSPTNGNVAYGVHCCYDKKTKFIRYQYAPPWFTIRPTQPEVILEVEGNSTELYDL